MHARGELMRVRANLNIALEVGEPIDRVGAGMAELRTISPIRKAHIAAGTS